VYLSAIQFFIGALGVFFRRNLPVVLAPMELILNAANLSFLAFSRDATGRRVVVFVVMALAAPRWGSDARFPLYCFATATRSRSLT